MKTVYIIFVCLVAVLAVVFALQNSAAITVTFFAWSLSASLSLLLIVTLVMGFFLGMLIMVPSIFRRKRANTGLKRQVSALEKEKAALGQGAGEPVSPDSAEEKSAQK